MEFYSELELINKAKAGNKSALNTLLSSNYSIVKGYVIKMTGDIELAQDIIQDTMLKAVLNLNKFEPKAKFSTWLIKIATNMFIDQKRKFKHFEELDEAFIDSHQGTEEAVISKLEYNEMMKVLMNISYEKRMVFILKHYYGYKYEEIADILNCPIGTVRSRLHNCIKQIISELERRRLINE